MQPTDIVPLAEQIAWAREEYDLRCRAFPELVERGHVSDSQAERNLRRCRGVVRTLEWLQANEAAIKASARAQRHG